MYLKQEYDLLKMLEQVFLTGKAVCEGYANLFIALGREIGVEVVFIGGKVRRDF